MAYIDPLEAVTRAGFAPEFDAGWIEQQDSIDFQRSRDMAATSRAMGRMIERVYETAATLPERTEPVSADAEIEATKQLLRRAGGMSRHAKLAKYAWGYRGTDEELFFDAETARLNAGALFTGQKDWKING